MTPLTPAEQVKLFKGCVYVLSENKVRLPNGTLLGRDQFNVTFGGRTFMMNYAGSCVTRRAWTAFVHSHVLPPPIA